MQHSPPATAQEVILRFDTLPLNEKLEVLHHAHQKLFPGLGLTITGAVAALYSSQRIDGGWGTPAETAYALHALICAREQGARVNLASIRAGFQWLSDQPLHQVGDLLWIGKDPYCPYRVDQMFVATALYRCERVLTQDPALV